MARGAPAPAPNEYRTLYFRSDGSFVRTVSFSLDHSFDVARRNGYAGVMITYRPGTDRPGGYRSFLFNGQDFRGVSQEALYATLEVC